MKFKLVESVELARQFVQELAYEAIDELGNKDLRDYLRWFDNQLEYYDLDKEEQEIAVTDFYIEAIDSGKIKRPKTMITSQLKDYIESNSNLLDNVEALMNNCPEHLRYELQLALDVAELNESLNQQLLTEGGPRGQEDLRKFICELLNTVCKTVLNPDDFMIHHKDGDHDNNHPKNIVLLPVGTRAVRTTGAIATSKRGKTLTNPNSSIHRYVSNSPYGVIQTSDHQEYLNIINNYNAIDVWRSLQKHILVYLDDKLLKRDLNKSLKNPTGRIN